MFRAILNIMYIIEREKNIRILDSYKNEKMKKSMTLY